MDIARHLTEGRPALAALLLLPALLLTGCPSRRPTPSGPPGLKAWIASDAEKVRPTDAPQFRRSTATMAAARGEVAACQVVVVADRADLTGVGVRCGALRSAGGAVIPAARIRLFREAMYEVSTASLMRPPADPRGLWPDALIPIGADSYYGEQRRGAPFDVARGRQQPVWVDIHVPQDAAPGDYSGEITATAKGMPPLRLPVRLHVWNFRLPQTSSLPTAFGYDRGILFQHPGVTEAGRQRDLVRLYVREGLAHRVSPWGLWLVNGLPWPEYDPRHPERGARIRDWSRWDDLYGPAMNGEPEGRATTMDVPAQVITQTGIEAPKVTARDATEGRGYVYRVTAINGEGETEGSAPARTHRPGVLSWQTIANARWPFLSAGRYNVYRSKGPVAPPREYEETATFFLATVRGTSFTDDGSREPDTNRPCPDANSTGRREALAVYREYAAHFRRKGWLDRAYLYAVDEPFTGLKLQTGRMHALLWREASPGGRSLVTNAYSPALDGAVNLWCVPLNWFDDGEHARASEVQRRQRLGETVWWYHGMMSRGDPLHKGGAWTSFFIDDSAMSARSNGLLTYRFGFQGLLYYLTTMAFADKANDPWRNQFYFSANGDGTLFYPGTPERIGGTHDIPVASLRLRFLRQGLQDYEYFRLMERLGAAGEARAIARELCPEADVWVQDRDHGKLEAARERMARRIEELSRRSGAARGSVRGR